MTGKDINALSIFGDYKQTENRITTALLHILNVGNEELIRFLLNKINRDLPPNKIVISAQDQQDDSVPDGTLECSFKFRIFIESKIAPNSINQKQLEMHKKLIRDVDENILLYITPDINKPKILDEDIAWVNWSNILNWLYEYIEKNNLKEGDLLVYLCDNFETLIINSNIIVPEWNYERNQRVVIFAGGKFGEETATRFTIYFCQNERPVKPSGYIGFYKDWRIKYCYKINEAPKDNQNLLDYPDILDYFKEYNMLDKEKPQFNWIYEPQKVFKLGEKVEINEIENDLQNEKGIPIPFTYGNQRYTNFDKLIKAKKTSELID